MRKHKRLIRQILVAIRSSKPEDKTLAEHLVKLLGKYLDKMDEEFLDLFKEEL